MDPALIFFLIRGLIRVGTAARDAYEQSVRDKPILMPAVPQTLRPLDDQIKQYFHPIAGLVGSNKLVLQGGPLERYWDSTVPNGGVALRTDEAYNAFLTMMAELERQELLASPQNRKWVTLRYDPASKLLDQWAPSKQPLEPWAVVALAIADVAIEFVSTNPGIVASGSSGETLLKAVCNNLRNWIPEIENKPQAYFVEGLAAAVLQAGFKTLADNSGLILTDKTAGDFVGKMAQPLADLFKKAVKDKNPSEQLTLTVFRDTVFPEMVSAGLKVLADHQQEVLGARFDPSNALGFFTQTFVVAISDQSVWNFASAKAWVPIYQSMLKGVAKRPDFFVSGGAASDKAIKDLITGIATKLSKAPPPPYNKQIAAEVAIDLAHLVIDQLATELPNRTSDPWLLLIPAALDAVVDGLNAGSSSVKDLVETEVSAVLRVVLAQAAKTPGMIVTDKSSVELQAIVSSIATVMAQDTKLLITADGWTQIAATAMSAAAKNPGKLFKINDATPEGQLATLLIKKLLTNAAAGFTDKNNPGQTLPASTARKNKVVLFGDTLAKAIEDTLTVAAGNAIGAAENIEQITPIIEALNTLVVAEKKPIGAADWNALYVTLIAQVFDKGTVNLSPEDLRKLLYHEPSPGVAL